jgi:Zn-dependent peptidase ImmA (M78 family)
MEAKMTNSITFANAYQLLEHMEQEGMVIQAPINLDEIAEKLGIAVQESPELEEKDLIGEIEFSVDGRPVVRINPYQNSYEPRRRFTLAHELGHFCLHLSSTRDGFEDNRKTMSRSESYWNKYESEANKFAAQLLMPKELIISEGKKIIEDYKLEEGQQSMPARLFIERLSDLLKVSNKAMEYRLKNLGVIK